MVQFGNGDLDKRMTFFAHLLAETSSTAIDDNALLAKRVAITERAFSDGLMASLENVDHYRATYRIFNRSGLLLYAAGEALELPRLSTLGMSEQTLSDGRKWRLIQAKSDDGNTYVVVGESSSTRWAALWPFLLMTGRLQGLIFSICIAVVWITASRAMTPLRELADLMSRRQAGDLSPVRPVIQFQETAPIVSELNDLLERASHRFENERGFLADAAHELRTPLAAVGIQAHLVMSSANPTERAAAAVALRSGVERVSHLLNQLLTIARIDTPGAKMPVEVVNAANIVRDRMSALMPLARGRAIALSLDASQELLFAVNPAGFVSIVDNLIDNAIRYASRGGSVQVVISLSDVGLTLTVLDDGPGIAPLERERVFERFYRVPGTLASGTGLGLAIVQKLVQAHNASIAFVEGLNGRGIGVEINMPMS
jgi:signal transduction histidine kinase